MAGQLTLGVELAGAVASQDAHVGAVGDVGSGPAVSSHVGELGAGNAQLLGVLGTHQHVSDDLGGLLTGQNLVGHEVALLVALKDTDGAHHRSGGGVLDLSLVVEVGSAGAHDRQAQNHHGSQSHAENSLEISHFGFPPYLI